MSCGANHRCNQMSAAVHFSQCVAVCVAVYCGVLRRKSSMQSNICCSALQSVCCTVLQCVLQCVAERCGVLPNELGRLLSAHRRNPIPVAVCCGVLQCGIQSWCLALFPTHLLQCVAVSVLPCVLRCVLQCGIQFLCLALFSTHANHQCNRMSAAACCSGVQHVAARCNVLHCGCRFLLFSTLSNGFAPLMCKASARSNVLLWV